MQRGLAKLYNVDRHRAKELLRALAERYLENGMDTLSQKFSLNIMIKTLWSRVRFYHRMLLRVVPDASVKLNPSIFPPPEPVSERNIILPPDDGIGLMLSNEKAFGKGINSRVRE